MQLIEHWTREIWEQWVHTVAEVLNAILFDPVIFLTRAKERYWWDLGQL
jgi:hypothetical protein